jgi:hypothetical protein
MNMVGHRKTLPGFAFEVLIAAHLHGHIAGKAQACFKLRPSKSTVELLANGQVSAALDALQKQGRVQEIPNREKRIRAIAKSYVESPQNTLIVSPDVSVYEDTDREFSAGDRIQFTAPDKSLSVANRDLAVIETIHSDGRLLARLDNNREIEFNGGEHRHFDHGYAVTSHSSQSLTAKRVLVNAATVTTSSLFLISGLVTMARERTIAASASRH